jgi:hypothetical protein
MVCLLPPGNHNSGWNRILITHAEIEETEFLSQQLRNIFKVCGPLLNGVQKGE